MAAYVIAQIEITDPEAFGAYRELVPATIEAHGGRYLARGGRTEVVEGAGPGRTVVLEFPSYEAALGWYNSEDYAGPKAMRMAASEGTITIVEGL